MADILDLESLIDYLPPTKIPEEPIIKQRQVCVVSDFEIEEIR